jgi:hypothetical protein
VSVSVHAGSGDSLLNAGSSGRGGNGKCIELARSNHTMTTARLPARLPTNSPTFTGLSGSTNANSIPTAPSP